MKQLSESYSRRRRGVVTKFICYCQMKGLLLYSLFAVDDYV